MDKRSKKIKTKKGKGRPTKYKAEFAQQAYKLCLLGFTDAQLAEFFEVNEDSIHTWKKVHKEFSESIKRGKLVADGTVAESLYKRANGIEYDETLFEKVDINQVGLAGEIIKVDAYKKKVTTKFIPPDSTAIIFWLKNRQSKQWRDKQEIDHTSQGKKIGTVPQVVIQNPNATK